MHSSRTASRRFLEEASALLASSLEVDTTFDHIARLVVPFLADWCIIDMAGEAGSVQTLAVAHHDPAREPLLREMVRRYSPNPQAPAGTARVLESGQWALVPEFSDDRLERQAVDDGHLQILRTLGIKSAIWVPLKVRGRTLGAIALFAGDSGRRYSADDLPLLEDLARRAALAIDHARLYSAERRAKELAERAVERTTRLQLVTAALAASLSRTQVAEVVLLQGTAAMGAYAGLILLRSADDASFEMLGQRGYAPDISETWRTISADATIPLTEAARSAAPIWIASRAAYAERYPHLIPFFSDRTEAIAAIPLIVGARSIGVLGLSFAESQTFAQDDRAFMQALAQQCTQALERARLYEAERAARAEAETAVRMRDVFLSIASHELKTPLTSLLGSVQLLQRRVARENSLSERDQRMLELINMQVSRLTRMVRALLDISRIQTGQFSIDRAPIDLCVLARRVVEEAELTLDEQHTLAYRGEDAPLMVDGDALRLEQVLQNLIDNAVKYSPAGGAVQVWVERRGSLACVAVRDQGIGIPADALPYLFERFYRAANADHQHISGLGVGLYVVKEVVTLHAGSVAVESAEGVGSTFTVCLPLRAGDT